MKKYLKLGSLVAMSLLFVTGCGEIPQLSNGEDAVVTFKNGDMISVDELYQKIKYDYALMSLENLINTYIYESEFSEHVADAKATADAEIDGLISAYGGEDSLLSALQQSSITSVDAYREIIYLSYLQEKAIYQYAEMQITDKQLEKYYDEESKGDIEISHILITTGLAADASEEEIAEADEIAIAKVEELIAEIKAAKKAGDDVAEFFAELANNESLDTTTNTIGGSLGKVNYGILSSAYDELLDAAYELNDGAYSTKVITTELGYHIVYKSASHELDTYDNLKEDILETLTENYVSTSISIGLDSMNYYRELYEVEVIDSELNDQYKDYIKEIENSINSAY